MITAIIIFSCILFVSIFYCRSAAKRRATEKIPPKALDAHEFLTRIFQESEDE